MASCSLTYLNIKPITILPAAMGKEWGKKNVSLETKWKDRVSVSREPSIVVYICNADPPEAEIRGPLYARGEPPLPSKFRTSQYYTVRPYLKKQNQ